MYTSRWTLVLAALTGLVAGCVTDQLPKVCTLTVTSGSGSGRYAPLASVAIVAQAAPAGTVFAGWSGDIADIADPRAPVTTIRMTQVSKDVDAMYKSIVAPPVPTNNSPPVMTSPYTPGSKFLDGKGVGGGNYCMIGSMGVRLLANDGSKTPCVNGWYFILDALINSEGAFTTARNTDGSYTFAALDFTSPRSGLKYRFIGWTVQHSADPLVYANPLTLTPGQLTETLRGYWVTVK